MVRDLLIWENNTGFYKISEGTGNNLSVEDEENGFVDYIMVDELVYDGSDFTSVDGAQVMLQEMYQDKFKDEADVISHLIDTGFIPDANYTVLYAV